jgi:flagellar basal-body rod protein FlgG
LNYEGVHQVSTQIDMRQGAVRSTGNQLDVAIQGDGFFAVTLGAGKTGFTRDGQFILDAQNRLVTPSGYPVVWSGTIPADAEEIQFQPNGEVMVKVGEDWNLAGTIQLTRFPNPTGLQINGNNVYVETVASGKPTAGQPGTTNYGSLMGQTVEGSNINMAEEMTHLITLQRGFQLSTRIFQATDTMLSQAIHVRKA